MREYKLVFLDIDGTILRPDHTVEASTKEAILQLQQKGVEVVIATGRPLQSVKKLAKSLSITSFITYNGAHCIYQGKEIYKEPISNEVVQKFFQRAQTHRHDFAFYNSKYNLFSTTQTEYMQKFIRSFHMEQNINYTPSFRGDIFGVTIITKEKHAHLHYQDFQDVHYTSVHVEGLTTCFDVIRDHVNKGVAVQHLMQTLGIPKEDTIAFGDGMNDKEMLMTVGEGFAMGNAHKDLFLYAKHTTTDVEHGGIYNGLKQLGIVQ